MLASKDSIRQYCTWLPAMMDVLLRTAGPVLEVGSGFGTPILRAYCQGYRSLTTVETDPLWFAELQKLPIDRSHIIVDNLPEIGFWDVALIDSAPAATRQPYINLLKSRCRFLVVHDTEPGNFEGYGYNFDGFVHAAKWNDLVPNTTVLTSPLSRDS